MNSLKFYLDAQVNLNSGIFINSLCKCKEACSTSDLEVTNTNKLLLSRFQHFMLYMMFPVIPVHPSLHWSLLNSFFFPSQLETCHPEFLPLSLSNSSKHSFSLLLTSSFLPYSIFMHFHHPSFWGFCLEVTVILT